MAAHVPIGVDVAGDQIHLSSKERSTHMHVLGASGQGKSKFLEQLIRHDIAERNGLCLIDPHGTLYHAIVAWCAHHGLHRRRRIHLIDPNDSEWTVAFDPLRCTDKAYLSTTVDAAVEACAQVWGGEDSNRTPLLKKCLRAIFYLLAAQGRSFGEALALTVKSDPDGLRAALIADLDDDIYRMIWGDLDNLSAREFAETFSSTQNRLMEFLSSPTIRRMLRLKENAIDLQQCMDNGDIVLVNLQPQKISNDNARLIGTLLTNSLFNTAIRRDEHVAERRPFYLYIDECYQFLTSDVEAMLDQTRKFGLHVILSHQHLSQLTVYGEHLYKAVMTNARTKIVFGGLADDDGETLARELLRETFDFNRPKMILAKPTVVGYERVRMKSYGVAEGRGVTSGESSVAMNMSVSAMGSGVVQSFGPDGLPLLTGHSTSETAASSSGSSAGHGRMSATSETVVVSHGEAEALQPILEILPTAVEGQEEIMHRSILALRKLPKRAFFMCKPDAPPNLLMTPPIASAPILPRRLGRFSVEARERSPFAVRIGEADEIIARRMEPEPPIDDDDCFSVPEE